MIVHRLLEVPSVYRLWQLPFAEQKLVPLRAHNDLTRVRRVLDVGCGPGTNTPHFAGSDYVGLDLNADYIAYARAQHRRRFLAVDVTRYEAPPGEAYDFVFLNSLLHHIGDEDTRRILASLAPLLTDDGHIHVLELVLPEEGRIPRLLARTDRGHFARPLARWRELFCEAFDPVVFEPYQLTLMGVTLWQMVYFKGRRRT